MKRILLLVLPIIVISTPMSARGDTQPASAKTVQTASVNDASDVGTRVAMRLVGKPMDTALMIVKSQRHALQIMKPHAQLALVMIGNALILFDHPMRFTIDIVHHKLNVAIKNVAIKMVGKPQTVVALLMFD